jgi:hypothetical protein
MVGGGFPDAVSVARAVSDGFCHCRPTTVHTVIIANVVIAIE